MGRPNTNNFRIKRSQPSSVVRSTDGTAIASKAGATPATVCTMSESGSRTRVVRMQETIARASIRNGDQPRAGGGGGAPLSKDSLVDLKTLDSLFDIGICAVLAVWVTLLAVVYTLVPPEDLVYLEGTEREAARTAFIIMLIGTAVTLMPFYTTQSWQTFSGSRNHRFSGIIKAMLCVQFVAGCTNALLAFAPTVVVVDPYTHARVYFVRWCEWIPLSGFMTFLSEVVDADMGMYGIVLPILLGLSQSLSCLCALVFPYCPSLTSWLVVMTVSVLLWAMVFPRLYYKYQRYKRTGSGISMLEMERSVRVQFGFHLLGACTICWSFLVALYFINMLAYHMYPDSFLVQTHGLSMTMDTLFDVTAKAFYMRLIVNVHETVFDAEGRAKRQLNDLKKMISILWEASSDVIVISVQDHLGVSSMVSPTFQAMLGVDPSANASAKRALMVTSLPMDKESDQLVSTSKFVNSTELPYYTDKKGQKARRIDDSHQEVDTIVNQQASGLVQAAWKALQSSKESGKMSEELLVLDLHKMDGSPLKVEVKLSRHSNNSVISVVRDVTERYLRFEAEKRAHDEYQARQKDALTVNRFTRHEIKNGLLAGIELCQEASKLAAFPPVRPARGVPVRQNSKGSLNGLSDDGEEHNAVNCIAQLDHTLHEVLDTVLAEAMAREIVHESYHPKLERVVLKTALGGGSKIKDEASKQRFPVHICPDSTPPLSMDPQLLRYIHRNAVSNAVKYGKIGGRVTTEVHYFEKKGEFELDVINEPGPLNEKLMAMGDKATDAVFAQGKRLKIHQGNNDDMDNNLSSGDGAWIMQRCAKTMGGLCSIRFDPHQTVFSFRCKVEPYTAPWQANEEFTVPEGTIGIAYDDSTIQRKLMKRIFNYVGIDEDKIIVKGKNPSDIKGFQGLLKKTLSKHPESNVLVLMDENLDYQTGGQNKRMSGSKHAQLAYQMLPQEDQDRVFLLVRSANDADSDIALYNQRTHGFFPKATIHKARVRELLAPAWYARFPNAQDIPREIVTHPPSDDEVESVLGNNDAVDEPVVKQAQAPPTRVRKEQPKATPTRPNKMADDSSKNRNPKLPRRQVTTLSKTNVPDLDQSETVRGDVMVDISEQRSTGGGSLFDIGDNKSTGGGSLFDIGERSAAGSTALFGFDDDESDDGSEGGEVWAAVMRLDQLVNEDLDNTEWENIWSRLHALKGDLPVLGDNKNLAMCVSLIEGLRGDNLPKNFRMTWSHIYNRISKEMQRIEKN